VTKYDRYNRSPKGRARDQRRNRTSARMQFMRQQTQVRRERAQRTEILNLAQGG
jgi:hypothetical protein